MINSSDQQIGAIVLAAGMSTRMGKPKMILPWGEKTIIEQVVYVMNKAKLYPVAVVTGKFRDLIIQNISHLDFIEVFNPNYENGEMVVSLQLGLKKIHKDCSASLIVLGDQPQVELRTVNKIIQTYSDTGQRLIIPSYQKRRGHPWLIGEKYWPEILNIQPPLTLNDFIKRNETNIKYVNIRSESILLDVDTPEEYVLYKPKK